MLSGAAATPRMALARCWRGRYDLGLFTFETFLNMALGSPRLLNQVGLVVLDEGQFITDPGRGITVELIFSLLLRARERGIRPQLLVLSAVIGSLNNFDRWLDFPVLFSRERPVPLVEGVLDRRGTFQFVDVDGMTKSETLLPAHQIVQRRKKAELAGRDRAVGEDVGRRGRKAARLPQHSGVRRRAVPDTWPRSSASVLPLLSSRPYRRRT